MNRRKFMTGSAIALVATGGLGTSRRLCAQGTGMNPAVYNSGSTLFAVATGNAFYGTPTAQDWINVQNNLSLAYADWTANGTDSQMQSYYNSLNPASVVAANMNQSVLLQNAQLVQPQMNLANIQTALTFLSTVTQSQLEEVISMIQQAGIAYYINVANMAAGSLSHFLTNSSTSSLVTSALLKPTPDITTPHPIKPPSRPGYNCATDGALILGAGIAFATLTVMTLGFVDVLAGAAWSSIALWGGLGTTGWGVGHVISGCNF